MVDFGRGTDFVSRDRNLDKRGGVHVIQAFFSLELPEEFQMQVTTALNKNQGSFSMVLLKEELLQQLAGYLTEEKLVQMIHSNTCYDELDRIRVLKSDKEFDQSKIDSKVVKIHKASMELREADAMKVKKYSQKLQSSGLFLGYCSSLSKIE